MTARKLLVKHKVINLIEEEKITLLNATHFNSDFTPNELHGIKNALITNSSVEAIELENIEIKNNIWQLLSESLALNNSIKSFIYAITMYRS